MRSMLIEDGNRLMIVDTGIGDKQNEKFFSHYYMNGTDDLKLNLKKLGYSTDDITDVFLTHLHFDHCGGAIQWNKDHTAFEPVFKNAIYWSNDQHWKWATEPNPREKASFLSENILPIQESGQLKFIERKDTVTNNVFNQMDVLFVDGHTDSMMIPHVKYQGKTIAFMADLLPSVGHIPLAYVMGYDTRPLITMTEKEQFLQRAVDEEFVLFLEHDSVNECCTLQMTEKGVRLKDTFKFEELFT
jgi:glyoxylase-like metal-dependent hydrolase (beta-lactamase superfamily II)